MNTVEAEHPAWCAVERCSAHLGGTHEGSPLKLTAGRGAGKAPRIMLLLTAPAKGAPVRVRIVTIGDLLINTLDVDVKSAAALADRLLWLVAQATQPNG